MAAGNVATMPTKELRPHEQGSVGIATVPVHESAPAVRGGMATIEDHPEWTLLSRLPMKLTSVIPLPGFRVRDLLDLRPGQMLTSEWLSTDDVPLKIGAVQLSWTEFEVVEQRMAIRLTRLA